MTLARTYLALAILGTVLPYWQLVSWLIENGIDLPSFLEEVTANRPSAFGWWDVLISGAVMIVLVVSQRHRLGSKWWMPLAGLAVGVSLSLPLFLYLQEKQRSNPSTTRD